MRISEWVRRRCSMMGIPAELLLERDGRNAALLDDPLPEDMFWFTWRITPLTPDPAVLSEDFWADSLLDTTVFRCKRSGMVADTAFWAGSQPVRDGRLVLRGAYVPVAISFRRHPILWTRLLFLGGGAHEPPPPDDL